MIKQSLFFAVVLIFSSLHATNYEWWMEPDQQPGQDTSSYCSIHTGAQKVLVLISKFPEDTATYYPPFYDSLLAPCTWELLNNPKYKWSISNYLYTASWGNLKMIGEVNPGMGGRYITAPHSFEWYLDTCKTDRLFTFEKDIINAIDPYVDFNDYDTTDDKLVDFLFFIDPLNPAARFGFKDSLGVFHRDSSNQGFVRNCSGDKEYFETNDKWDKDTTKYVTVTQRVNIGSAMSYYDLDPGDRINLLVTCAGCLHELGHYFNSQTVNYPLKQSNGDYEHALPDRYDYGTYHGSGGAGKYTAMQLGCWIKHAQLYTPWERMVLGWFKPMEINTNSQNVTLGDFNLATTDETRRAYLIPVDSITRYPPVECTWPNLLREYFLIANYQPDDHWLDELGRCFPEELELGAKPGADGLLVWHVNDRFWCSDNMNNELAKYEDLECAEGLKNLYGNGPSPFGTEAGWDRIDRWSWWSDSSQTRWWASNNKASMCDSSDFFNPAYKTAFHTLMNPSSDGYNNRTPYTYTYNFTYPDNSVERFHLQNLPTHVSLEGIHYSSPGVIQLCIRRSRIWTDEEVAMDRTTQRKFICDSDDTFHFIYPLKGHIYYTKTYDPSLIWFKAEMVGPQPLYYDSIGYGIWPALALDNNNSPMAVFFDTSCSKVLYSYREETIDSAVVAGILQPRPDTTWKYPLDTLDLSGIPGPVAIDYGYGTYGSTVNPGGIDGTVPPGSGTDGPGTVHLAYITRDNGQDKLCYARFFKTKPENLAEEILDTDFTEDTRILGASIEVDSQYNRIYIAYGCRKGDTSACYYFMKNSSGWNGPYKFASSKSDTLGEPLVPFLDIESNTTEVLAVFNANDKVYVVSKPRSNDNLFSTATQVSNVSGRNRYPQVGGNEVTWTCYVTADSGNVYKRTLPGGTTTRFDAAYDGKSYFAHVTKYGSGAAELYQHGTFTGPKWAIYNGSGGNQESDGKPVVFIPPSVFKMSIPDNILVGSKLSIFTTGGDCMITVYDVSGRQVVRQELKGVQKLARIETPVDCDGWAKGVYFVRAVPKDGKVATSKVVLVR